MTMSNITVILVDRTAELKQSLIKKFDAAEIYKKCGFKTTTDFRELHSWPVTYKGVAYVVSLYGKTNGKAGTENKYDFPPPADNLLLFGTCCLVLKKTDTKNATSLTLDVWEKIHAELFGGFEDINDADSDDSDTEEVVDDENKTASGYEKDGFVVSDTDSTDSDVDDDLEMSDVEDDMEVEAEAEAEAEAEVEAEVEADDDDVEPDEDDDDDDDKDDDDDSVKPKKRKIAAKKPASKGKGRTKSKGGNGASDNIIYFESNELELDPYIDTDDEM